MTQGMKDVVPELPKDPSRLLLKGVETTGEGIASKGLKRLGKSLLRGVETVGEGVVSSENCKASVGSTEEKCGDKEGVSCPS